MHKLLVRVSSYIHVRGKHLGLLLWTLVPKRVWQARTDNRVQIFKRFRNTEHGKLSKGDHYVVPGGFWQR
jgi:hypothetical protein